MITLLLRFLSQLKIFTPTSDKESMKNWILISSLLMSHISFAQEEDCKEETPKVIQAVMKAADQSECPNKKKLMGMCMLIGSRTKDKQPIGPSEHLYYRRILEASCVDESKDSEKTVQSKIQKMWLKFEEDMTCDIVSFDVTNGSQLKYAVATRFDEFLEQAIEWQVNLNKVDKSDGRTLLDYVKYHMERNKGNTIEKKMKHYYDILREGGAKHKSEL